MLHLAHYYRIVEEAISKLGIDPATTRGPQPGQWNLKRGSASLSIDIFQIPPSGKAFFGISSPIMRAPETGTEGFYRYLLELNQGMIGVGFSLIKENVLLRSSRMLEGLDAQEAFQMISQIGLLADHFDDKLRENYPHRQPIGFRPSYMEELPVIPNDEDASISSGNQDSSADTQQDSNTDTQHTEQ